MTPDLQDRLRALVPREWTLDQVLFVLDVLEALHTVVMDVHLDAVVEHEIGAIHLEELEDTWDDP